MSRASSSTLRRIIVTDSSNSFGSGAASPRSSARSIICTVVSTGVSGVRNSWLRTAMNWSLAALASASSWAAPVQLGREAVALEGDGDLVGGRPHQLDLLRLEPGAGAGAERERADDLAPGDQRVAGVGRDAQRPHELHGRIAGGLHVFDDGGTLGGDNLPADGLADVQGAEPRGHVLGHALARRQPQPLVVLAQDVVEVDLEPEVDGQLAEERLEQFGRAVF